MKKIFLVLLAILSLAAKQPSRLTVDEKDAIAVLRSNATVAKKEAACLRLKQVGGAASVPALADLINDQSLSQWAIDALQTMPSAEAGQALVNALPKASGKTKSMVIFALGSRRETAAVKPLGKSLFDSDPAIGAASAMALGRIGNNAALAALRKARSVGAATVRTAVNNALLTIADDLRTSGKIDKARSIYKELRASNQTPQVSAAAFRGLALSETQNQTQMILDAINGSNETEQTTAIELLRDMPGEQASKAFSSALPKASPAVQIALLEALRQNGAANLAGEVESLTRVQDASVKLAAIRTLGEIGGPANVALLTRRAAKGTEAERSEAREALATLHRGNIHDAMLSEIQNNSTEIKIEIVRAISRRLDRAATPALMQLAGGNDEKVAIAAIGAIEVLAEGSNADDLLVLLSKTNGQERRNAAVAAFVAVAGRGGKTAEFSGKALKMAAGAKPDLRCALLDAAAQIGGPDVLDALRAALKDANADVRSAALTAMAENAGDQARPDLIELAKTADSQSDRAEALQGYWRLVEAMASRPMAERLSAVRDGLAVAKTPAEKKLGLARLADLRGADATELARSFLDDPQARQEAEMAYFQIAKRFDASELAGAQTTFQDLASKAENEQVRKDAADILKKLQDQAGSLSSWLVSGPYRQEGKVDKELFDIAFAPETKAEGVEWKNCTGGNGLTDYWILDLLPIANGNHCVIYLKTRVFCPTEQPVKLEIGSDDGVKLWINGALAHSNNVLRGFTPGEDKASATLKQGWNDFLMKITQSTAGCAASVRVRAADGSVVAGIKDQANQK